MPKAGTADQRVHASGMVIQWIQPGMPNRNAYVERSNSTCREDVLDQCLIARLEDVREATWQFLIDCSEHCPRTPSAV